MNGTEITLLVILVIACALFVWRVVDLWREDYFLEAWQAFKWWCGELPTIWRLSRQWSGSRLIGFAREAAKYWRKRYRQ